MAETQRFAHHMSDADALMWNIEKDPILRSTIVAVGLLDREPDFDRLRRRLTRASIAIPRLRQRVLSPVTIAGSSSWSRRSRSRASTAPARCGSSRWSRASPAGAPPR